MKRRQTEGDTGPCHILRAKTALVTGGSSSIRFASARMPRDNGAHVAIMGRSQGKLDRAVAERGGSVLAIRY